MIRDEGMLQQLLSTIRDFVKNELIPSEHEVAENDIPEDIVQQMRELGLFGLTIPEEYGGLGITMEEEVNVAFELGQTSPAFRSLIGTNNGIGSSGF
jgi:acyl-CoA dehydrogenase